MGSPTHLVPPGTEPDLQAINNPYVAAARARTQAPTIPFSSPVYNFSGVTQSGPPPVLDSTSKPQSDVPIDPALLARAPRLAGAPTSVPKHNIRRLPEGGSSSESESSSECDSRSDSGSSDDDKDDMPDVGWAATGQARDAHPGMYSSGLEYLLTPS